MVAGGKYDGGGRLASLLAAGFAANAGSRKGRRVPVLEISAETNARVWMGRWVPRTNAQNLKLEEQTVAFSVPPLPYSFDALEPHIDARTMEIHHDKHHGAYVTNLNKALDGQAALQGKSLEDLLKNLDAVPDNIRNAVRNNAGGHWNHSLFWTQMKKGGGGEPKGDLGAAINSAFGSFAGFQEKFAAAGLGRFGSGWAWLMVKDGKLVIDSTPNQDTPISLGGKAVLGLDVWEHAYYLKYQNVRGDYIKAWWNVVNWDSAAEHYAGAKK